MKSHCLKALLCTLVFAALTADAATWKFESIQSAAPTPMYPATNLLYKLQPSFFTNNNANSSASSANVLVNGAIPVNTTSGAIAIYNNSSIGWTFDTEQGGGVKLHSIRIATSYTDTGRSRITVAKICIKTVQSGDEWLTLENSAASDNISAKSKLGVFSDDTGALLADGVTALLIDFGPSQQNKYAYYSEVEAATVAEGPLMAKLSAIYPESLGTLSFTPELDANNMVLKDSELSVLATPKEGYEFLFWEGNVAEEDKYENPLKLTMDNYKTINAVFSAPWTYSANTLTDGYWKLTTKTENGGLTITKAEKLLSSAPVFDLRKPITGTDLPVKKNNASISYDSTIKIMKFADTMTYIGGAFCFRNNTELTEVQLPANLQSISKNAFYQCSKLKMVYPLLPDSLATIDGEAFAGCPLSGRLEVNNPGVTSIASSFYGCWGLKEMDFSKSSLTTINDFCFRDCSGVTNIYFPATLNILAKDCLYRCNALRSVYLESKPATIHFGALEGVPSSMRLVIFEDDNDWMEHLAICETNATTPFVAWDNLSANAKKQYTFTDTKVCKPYGTVKLGSACSTVFVATRTRNIPGLLLFLR